MAKASKALTVLEPVEPLIRGERVLLDSDLARIYDMPTFRFNEAVKRNLERFPEDFRFQLTPDEAAALTSQIAMSKPGRGGRRTRPYAFTEHGAIMAANVLNSPRAVQMSVLVVRAFVALRKDALRPAAWTSALTTELLWVLESTVAAQPELNALLSKILAAPLFTAADFPTPTAAERAAPGEEAADNQRMMNLPPGND